MTHEQIKAHILDTFKHNPKAEKLHVTSDGQCFTPENKSYALLHSRNLLDKRIATLTRVDAEDLDLDDELDEGEIKEKEAAAQDAEDKAKKLRGAAATAKSTKEAKKQEEINQAEAIRKTGKLIELLQGEKELEVQPLIDRLNKINANADSATINSELEAVAKELETLREEGAK